MSLDHYLPDLTNPTVCDLFKSAARDTWARIYFSRKTPRLKIHETSISQNLVYEMNLIKSRFPALKFDIFESFNEQANGDDLELTVRQADGFYFTYAIQSKIIYHRRLKGVINLKDGHYQQFKHTVGKGAAKKNQVDLLLKYAGDNDFIPLYMLYNYASRDLGPGFDPELFGCTVIGAKYLKRYHSGADGNLFSNVKFSDLHTDRAFPWHELVCILPFLSRRNMERRLRFDRQSPLLLAPAKALIVSSQWKPLDTSFPAKISEEFTDAVYYHDFNGTVEFQEEKEDEPRIFLPKYKITVDPTNLKE